MKLLFQQIKLAITKSSGYWFYRANQLPVGAHLFYFLTYRIRFRFSLILDVGANIGQFALRSAVYFPKSTIYAFEPFTKTYEILQRNTSRKKNIHCVRLGFSDEAQQLYLPVRDASHSDLNSIANQSLASHLHHSYDHIDIDKLSAWYTSQTNLPKIDLLKVDTEGFDKKVLIGASELLSRGMIKLVYTEVGLSQENRLHVHLSEMMEFMEQNGYIFLGLYGVDIRKVGQRPPFGNALFVHKQYAHAII